MRPALTLVLHALLEETREPGARLLSLDRVAEAIGTVAVSADEVELLVSALEAEGRLVLRIERLAGAPQRGHHAVEALDLAKESEATHKYWFGANENENHVYTRWNAEGWSPWWPPWPIKKCSPWICASSPEKPPKAPPSST